MSNINITSRRIGQINIPGNLHSDIGLTRIYGIGRSSAIKILSGLNINPTTKIAELTEKQISAISAEIEKNYKTEGELRRDVSLNIKRLMEIGCYRGIRHRKGLPVNGQSTKTNARTRKGRRKTVANKKKAA
ncbi:30S ribosomal protein S13 [Spiroplasma sp. JKS002669]|uniref:30S ribosomal protein S13 n=1 Tax=Spiroplasma attinicola TaxID=2904537 RepID=UPI000A27A982|nr:MULTISPECIES: 30S ribosomal protein S13 [unclassified Spiroplasma]MCL6428945.1 30S ribosomal protein S13 [Spiroplasma sp. JKS002669]MCL8209747.1 30S ribosomal protein S13 [Spiroplasma sp. JKS002670]MCL8210563.1 30S ribosomal protein S13 [Spiroplasma sp. JKS002671]